MMRSTNRSVISRPNTAPAYYLGHPAHLWITVMRPQLASAEMFDAETLQRRPGFRHRLSAQSSQWT
jgi:hypothetical protein